MLCNEAVFWRLRFFYQYLHYAVLLIVVNVSSKIISFWTTEVFKTKPSATCLRVLMGVLLKGKLHILNPEQVHGQDVGVEFYVVPLAPPFVLSTSQEVMYDVRLVGAFAD